MEALYPPDGETEKEREGTAGHWAATEGVQGRPQRVGWLAPNGYPINQEMIDGADHFVRDVLAECSTAGAGAMCKVETKVYAHETIHPQNEGTPDAVLFDPSNRRIIVWDYKYGHRSVQAFRNWQLIDYLAGTIETADYNFEEMGNWTFSLRIVQPRDYRSEPLKTWDLTGAQVIPHIVALRAAAHAATAPNAPTIPGPHCRDCEARAHCPALALVGGYAMDLAGESIPQELDNAGIGRTLRAIKAAIARLEALETGLEEVAAHKIRSGERIPHWRLGPGETREKWMTPAEEVIALGDNMGLNLRKAVEPITPAQARKAGLDAALCAAYAQKPPGAIKLLPADATDAAKAFS